MIARECTEMGSLTCERTLRLARCRIDSPSRLKQRNTLSRVKVSHSVYNALVSHFNIHPHVEDFIVAFGTDINNVSAASPPAVVRARKDLCDEHNCETGEFGSYTPSIDDWVSSNGSYRSVLLLVVCRKP